ncbi:MAG: hypothetical protein AB1505_15535 [Candidatus Latescibacterota bacterium]
MADADGGGLWLGGVDQYGLLRGGSWAGVSRLSSGFAPQRLLLDRHGNLWMASGFYRALIRWPMAALPTSVATPRAPSAATSFQLFPGYPNPFNSETQISFVVPDRQHLCLRVWGASGQLVTTLADGSYDVGMHQVLWEGRDDGGRSVASGLYLCQLARRDVRLTQKLALVR